MNKGLIIQFTRQDSAGDEWVRLVQEENDEQSVLTEAAELIDSLFEINPCDEDSEASDEVITEEEFQAQVASTLSLPNCDLTFEKDFLARVRVIRSSQGVDYELRFTNGELQTVETVETQVDGNITVKDVSSVDLGYPITGPCSFSWYGSPVSRKGILADRPKITYTSTGTLSWDQDLTGIIHCVFPTVYDLAKVIVFNDEGEVGESEAICFYSKQTDVITLTFPDYLAEDLRYTSEYCADNVSFPDGEQKPLWEDTETKYYCQCSGEYSYSTFTPPPTEAQKLEYVYPGITKVVDGGYINCGETTGDINDPLFYEQTCCEEPAFSLPDCQYLYRKKSNGAELPDATKAEYEAQYGELVEFIPVSPEDGDCGTTVYKQVKTQQACCDEVEPLVWDEENSVEVIADNSSGVVYVTGGKLPLFASVRGTGFYLDAAGTIRDAAVYGRNIVIYTKDSCGTGTVTISDGCSTVQGIIRSTEGQWVSIPLSQLPATFRNVVSEPITTPFPGSTQLITGIQGEYKVDQYWTWIGTFGSATPDYGACYPGVINCDPCCDNEAIKQFVMCDNPGYFPDIDPEQNITYVIPYGYLDTFKYGYHCTHLNAFNSDAYEWAYTRMMYVNSQASAKKWVC